VRRERLPLQQKQGPSRKDRNHMHTARTSINSLSQWSVTLRPAISMPMDNISVESMAAKTDITKYCRGSRRRACTKPTLKTTHLRSPPVAAWRRRWRGGRGALPTSFVPPVAVK
jgi:hypothetical protein